MATDHYTDTFFIIFLFFQFPQKRDSVSSVKSLIKIVFQQAFHSTQLFTSRQQQHPRQRWQLTCPRQGHNNEKDDTRGNGDCKDEEVSELRLGQEVLHVAKVGVGIQECKHTWNKAWNMNKKCSTYVFTILFAIPTCSLVVAGWKPTQTKRQEDRGGQKDRLHLHQLPAHWFWQHRNPQRKQRHSLRVTDRRQGDGQWDTETGIQTVPTAAMCSQGLIGWKPTRRTQTQSERQTGRETGRETGRQTVPAAAMCLLVLTGWKSTKRTQT